MKMKILLGTFIALTLALVVGLGTSPSAAQTPEPTPTNDSPFTAVYADFREHYLGAGMHAWYKFDYGGGNKPITIVIPNGGLLGLEFRVYTPEQGRNFVIEDRFIARVTPKTRRCGDEICTIPDLIWTGGFHVAGTYYVRVTNPNSGWRTFYLFVTGENVSHGVPTPTPEAALQPIVVPSPIILTTTVTTTVGITTTTLPTETVVVVSPVLPPLLVPTPTPTRLVQNDSPYTAIYVPDNREQNIHAKSEMWYKFDYGGDRSRVLIILYNGNVSGLWFAIFDPQQALRFTENKFVGRGMPQPILCDQGKCSSNDLVWSGSFAAPGTYYIRVTNPNNQPWTFKLHIEGTNINIIE